MSPGNDNKMRDWQHYLYMACRLFLGAVFVYASLGKVHDPAAFAKAVYNYQILPEIFVNIVAIVLPWLELIVGILLITGLFLPGTVFLVNVLMLIFFGALLFNVARGLDINCGCFSTTSGGGIDAPMAWYLVRDGIFLLSSFFLFYRVNWVKRAAWK